MELGICFREVTGGIVCFERAVAYGLRLIRIEATPDRILIAGDACNVLVCYNHHRYLESGYGLICKRDLWT